MNIPRPKIVTPNIAVPNIKSPAERIWGALRETHERYVAQAASEADLPAGYLHLPSGAIIRIRTVGRRGPLLRFEALDEDPSHTTVLVAPDSVVVTMTKIPPESDEPRGVKIGFPVPGTDESE
jgi:hypothetical protein